MIDADLAREVLAAEARLRSASLRADVRMLDALLHEDMTFISNGGPALSKTGYLDLYRSGRLRMSSIESSQRQLVDEGCGLIRATMRMDVIGTTNRTPFTIAMNVTRFWRDMDNGWRVVAGNCHLAD